MEEDRKQIEGKRESSERRMQTCEGSEEASGGKMKANEEKHKKQGKK